MASKSLTEVLRHLARSAKVQTALSLSDAELLREFVRSRDDVAFEALLHRHGPLVFGVCRRLLSCREDAEDAFQATFLVLARRADSVSRPALLGNWLYGVAHRIAARAHRNTCRRRSREQAGADLTAAPGSGANTDSDRVALLHQEVNRLPAKYRAAVVLCYLEGKTNEEAARQLGWPVSTVKGRLSLARELLRSRLARSGVVLTAGFFSGATAAVPAELLAGTVEAGLSFAGGSAPTGGVASAQALTLAKGVLQAMLLTKLKIIGALVLSASLSLVGGGIAYHTLAGEPAAQEKSASGQKESSKPKGDPEMILGTWKVTAVEAEGKDVSNEPGEPKTFMQSTWTITKDKIVMKSEGQEAELTYKLDPGKKPRALDVTLVKGPVAGTQGQSRQGVYALDGDTLKICLPFEADSARPAEVATQEGSKSLLLVLKRQK